MASQSSPAQTEASLQTLERCRRLGVCQCHRQPGGKLVGVTRAGESYRRLRLCDEGIATARTWNWTVLQGVS